MKTSPSRRAFVGEAGVLLANYGKYLFSPPTATRSPFYKSDRNFMTTFQPPSEAREEVPLYDI